MNTNNRLFVRGVSRLPRYEQEILATMLGSVLRTIPTMLSCSDTLVCEYDSVAKEVELMMLLTEFDVSWSPHDYRSN